MKIPTDPRHLKRTKLVQKLFAYSFSPDKKNVFYSEKLAKITALIKEIDAKIEIAAPQFPVEKIAKVDVAILRLAIYELLYEKKEPPKVIIDEAIELAHELGGQASSSFVNGVLGTLYKQYAP